MRSLNQLSLCFWKKEARINDSVSTVNSFELTHFVKLELLWLSSIVG